MLSLKKIRAVAEVVRAPSDVVGIIAAIARID